MGIGEKEMIKASLRAVLAAAQIQRSGSATKMFEGVERSSLLHSSKLDDEVDEECVSLKLSSGGSQSPSHTFQQIQQAYSAGLYGYGMMRSVDLLYHMTLVGMVESSQSLSACVSRWIVDPRVFAQKRQLPEIVIGYDRWLLLQRMITWIMKDHDETTSQVVKTVRQTGVDPLVWIPFLRGLAFVGVYDFLIAQHVPHLVESILAGKVDAAKLDGEARDRAVTFSTLLASVAAEFGSSQLSVLSLEILQREHISPSYAIMLLHHQAISKSASRRSDWLLRQSGEISSIASNWMKSYFPVVYLDSRKPEISSPSTSTQARVVLNPDPNLDGAGDYFQSANSRYGQAAQELANGYEKHFARIKELEKSGALAFCRPTTDTAEKLSFAQAAALSDEELEEHVIERVCKTEDSSGIAAVHPTHSKAYKSLLVRYMMLRRRKKTQRLNEKQERQKLRLLRVQLHRRLNFKSKAE